MTDPLPCPFCGDPPLTNHNGVECGNRECWAQCRVIIPDSRSSAERRRSVGPAPLDEAIKRWNTRAPVKLKPCGECGVDMGTTADEQRCQQHS